MKDKRPSNGYYGDDKEANMFGILPCPMCKSRYRWPSQPHHPKHSNSIICDGCGLVQIKDESWEKA